MPMGIIQRNIFRQFLKGFLTLTVGFLVGVSLSAALVDVLSGNANDAFGTDELLRLSSWLQKSIPPVTLTVTCLVLWSLARRNETKALCDAGIGHKPIRAAAVTFGVVSCVILAVLDIWVTPCIREKSSPPHIAFPLQPVILEELLKGSCLVSTDGTAWLCTDAPEGDEWLRVTAVLLDLRGHHHQIVEGAVGQLEIESDGKRFRLLVQPAYLYTPQGEPSSQPLYALEFPLEWAELRQDWAEYGLGELLQHRARGKRLVREIEAVSPAPGDAVESLFPKRAKSVLARVQQRVSTVTIAGQLRLAALANCLLFAFLSSGRFFAYGSVLRSVGMALLLLVCWGGMALLFRSEVLGHPLAALLPHAVILLVYALLVGMVSLWERLGRFLRRWRVPPAPAS